MLSRVLLNLKVCDFAAGGAGYAGAPGVMTQDPSGWMYIEWEGRSVPLEQWRCNGGAWLLGDVAAMVAVADPDAVPGPFVVGWYTFVRESMRNLQPVNLVG